MTTNTSSSIIDTRKELVPSAIPGGAGFTIDQSVVTNTTTVDRPLGSVVTDVSYIPYMRGLAIDYVSYKMRPLRQVWHYFDDVPVNKFIQKPNIIETTSRDTALRDIIKGNRETIQIGSSTAKVLLTETNQTDGNTRIYVTEFVNPSSFSIGSSISSLGSSYTSSVKNYQHYSGIVGANSTIQNIIFSQDADGTTEDFYTGNTLTIVCGPNAGESREIIYYNQTTKTATVDPAFSNVSPNSIYSIGDVRSPWSSNNTQGTYITERGFLAGVLHIPDPTQNFVKFRTGDRIFKILDNPRDDSATATTKAEYRFVSNGLNLNKAQIIEKTKTVNIDSIISLTIDPTPSPTPTPTVTPTRSITPTPSVTSTVTPTPTVTPTATPTPTASVSSTPAVPASPTPTPTKSVTPTPVISVSPTPSTTPGASPTPTATVTPTKTPTPTPSLPQTGTICDPGIFNYILPSQLSLNSSIVNNNIYGDFLDVYMENFNYQYVNARGEPITGYPNVPVAFQTRLTRWGNVQIGESYFISEAEVAAYPGPNIRWIIGYVNGQYIWRNITEAQKTAYSIASGGAGVPGSYYAYVPAGTRFPSGTNIGWGTGAQPRATQLGPRVFLGPNGSFNVIADGLYVAPALFSMDYIRACGGGAFFDPIAQTFYVDTVNNNDGIFLSSVDLFFKNKGTLPVEVQIRPTVNGYPSSNTVIPGAVTVLEPEDVHISDLPSTSNASTNTRFTFASPVYLNSGYEYSLVVVTDDPDYDYYCAELGQTVLGSDRVVSKQPFTGSLFKSQNGTTWTAYQDEDMMFMLNKTRFLNSTGTVYFSENKDSLIAVGTSNNYMDSFEVQSDAIELKSTNLQYYYKAKSNTTGVLDSSYTQFSPENKVNPTQRKVVTSPDIVDKSFDLRIDLSSTNQDVSPIVYHNRQNLIAIENFINNTGLREEQFVITNPGTGYTDNASVTITSNNVGYGANAYAVANVTTGNIVSIIVDNAGTGYVGDVTAVISGGGGSDATLAVTTETGTSGGPAVARYISKTVTLLDGFDAGDLRVFVTAIKPPGANVELYYKVRNSLDTQQIENRTWNRMVQKTSQYTYSIDGEQIEYEYRPSLTSNNIVYTNGTTTFKTFNQFTLKIVLTSDGTVASKLPYVYDLRAIALPADVY